jgi:hypothetical protein
LIPSVVMQTAISLNRHALIKSFRPMRHESQIGKE